MEHYLRLAAHPSTSRNHFCTERRRACINHSRACSRDSLFHGLTGIECCSIHIPPDTGGRGRERRLPGRVSWEPSKFDSERRLLTLAEQLLFGHFGNWKTRALCIEIFHYYAVVDVIVGSVDNFPSQLAILLRDYCYSNQRRVGHGKSPHNSWEFA